MQTQIKNSKIEIADKDMGLYLKLRAELVKYWFDKHNGHNYNCTISHAIDLAELEIMNELMNPDGLIISMEDLLMNDIDTNSRHIVNVKIQRIKKIVLEYLNNLENEG